MLTENNSLSNFRSKFIKNIQIFSGGKIVAARNGLFIFPHARNGSFIFPLPKPDKTRANKKESITSRVAVKKEQLTRKTLQRSVIREIIKGMLWRLSTPPEKGKG